MLEECQSEVQRRLPTPSMHADHALDANGLSSKAHREAAGAGAGAGATTSKPLPRSLSTCTPQCTPVMPPPALVNTHREAAKAAGAGAGAATLCLHPLHALAALGVGGGNRQLRQQGAC